jgi:hypothetical protein
VASYDLLRIGRKMLYLARRWEVHASMKVVSCDLQPHSTLAAGHGDIWHLSNREEAARPALPGPQLQRTLLHFSAVYTASRLQACAVVSLNSLWEAFTAYCVLTV